MAPIEPRRQREQQQRQRRQQPRRQRDRRDRRRHGDRREADRERGRRVLAAGAVVRDHPRAHRGAGRQHRQRDEGLDHRAAAGAVAQAHAPAAGVVDLRGAECAGCADLPLDAADDGASGAGGDHRRRDLLDALHRAVGGRDGAAGRGVAVGVERDADSDGRRVGAGDGEAEGQQQQRGSQQGGETHRGDPCGTAGSEGLPQSTDARIPAEVTTCNIGGPSPPAADYTAPCLPRSHRPSRSSRRN